MQATGRTERTYILDVGWGIIITAMILAIGSWLVASRLADRTPDVQQAPRPTYVSGLG